MILLAAGGKKSCGSRPRIAGVVVISEQLSFVCSVCRIVLMGGPVSVSRDLCEDVEVNNGLLKDVAGADGDSR